MKQAAAVTRRFVFLEVMKRRGGTKRTPTGLACCAGTIGMTSRGSRRNREAVGRRFELLVPLRVRRISSAVLSTTQPPHRGCWGAGYGRLGRCGGGILGAMGARAAGKVTRRKTVVDVGAGGGAGAGFGGGGGVGPGVGSGVGPGVGVGVGGRGKGRSGHQAKQQGKVRRLLVMLSLLKSAEAMTPALLAERLGVNPRQITRDLKELMELGFKIEYDRMGRRYNISGGIFMPPLELEAEEAFALVLLAEQVAGKHQVDHLGPAATAIAKITSTLPDAVRTELESSRGKVRIRATLGGEEGPHDVYDGFRRAVARGEAMQCRYDSARGMQEQRPGEEFVLRPYALLFHLRAWYVVGYNQERGEVRMYKISRFRKAVATKERYAIPPDFSLDKYLGNAWRVVTDKQDYEVELLFSREIAPTITETRWHKTEETEHNADGTVTYRFTVSGLTEISWWILGYGPMVKVVRPKELAERVAELARKAAEQYE